MPDKKMTALCDDQTYIFALHLRFARRESKRAIASRTPESGERTPKHKFNTYWMPSQMCYSCGGCKWLCISSASALPVHCLCTGLWRRVLQIANKFNNNSQSKDTEHCQRVKCGIAGLTQHRRTHRSILSLTESASVVEREKKCFRLTASQKSTLFSILWILCTQLIAILVSKIS